MKVSADVQKALTDFSKVAPSFIPKDCGFIMIAFRDSDDGIAMISNLETPHLMAKLRELAEQDGPKMHIDLERTKPS